MASIGLVWVGIWKWLLVWELLELFVGWFAWKACFVIGYVVAIVGSWAIG